MNWPFSDPPNVAVFTSKAIVAGDDWIYYVSHDEDDGAWQFHGHGGFTEEKNACVTGLEEICKIEPRILELSDLSVGWCAWRESINAAWQRSRMEG